MIKQTLSTTIRVTGDVWCHQGSRVQQLYPLSALRIADNHLHSSGIIEHIDNCDPHRLYVHDWFCISQAVHCSSPINNLLKKSLRDSAESSIFVSKVGASSIHFGNALTLNNELLATTFRVFCRKHISGESAPFTDAERNRFVLQCAPQKNICEFPMPQLARFDKIVPAAAMESQPILSVMVGPQHVNFGNHADHAFLAETVHHALSLTKIEHNDLAINYIEEVKLGDMLECFSDTGKVYVAKSTEGGERRLALIAK